ncbi:MAG TPA: NAD(P)/FAD-dependent oxidoreductase [Pseudonocardia sp.]
MRTTAVVIGGGQAGLAMSWWLTRSCVDHVVLERGAVAQSWRAQRWNSLRLLTPNWMSRLPGHGYDGDDPEGYRRAGEVVAALDAYARSFAAPVRPHTTVLGVVRTGSGFQVNTDDGAWRCRTVVVATGTEGEPRVPAIATDLPGHLHQISALRYREPGQVTPGRVLVVGASASGVQIADELRRAGRQVTVAVGDHVRVPRTYRGRDIYRWMDELGILDERYDEVEDLARARRLPSLQLAGTPGRRSLDLAALSAAGVELTGRLVGVDRGRAQFSGSLANLIKSADLKQARLLERVDAHIDEHDLHDLVGPPDRPSSTPVPAVVTDLKLASFSAVVWATGNRPTYPWLDPALLDRRGAVRHDGGVVEVPGMYVLGLPFTRRRGSNLLAGVGSDARLLCAHILGQLRRPKEAA